MLLSQQLLNVTVKTTAITSNVIVKTIAHNTPLQDYFLNVALSGIILSGGE